MLNHSFNHETTLWRSCLKWGRALTLQKGPHFLGGKLKTESIIVIKTLASRLAETIGLSLNRHSLSNTHTQTQIQLQAGRVRTKGNDLHGQVGSGVCPSERRGHDTQQQTRFHQVSGELKEGLAQPEVKVRCWKAADNLCIVLTAGATCSIWQVFFNLWEAIIGVTLDNRLKRLKTLWNKTWSSTL